MTDDEVSLVRRVVSGDEAALATAFDRFAPALTRYAWAVSATPDDVEHAVQDSFLSLWIRAAGLELPTGSLLPWLLAECRSHANTRGADVSGGDPLRWLQQDVLALAEVDRRLVALCLVTGRTWSATRSGRCRRKRGTSSSGSRTRAPASPR